MRRRRFDMILTGLLLAFAAGCGAREEQGEAGRGADNPAGGTRLLAGAVVEDAETGAARRQGADAFPEGKQAEIKRLVEFIGKNSRGGAFVEYDGARREKIHYSGERVSLTPDGRLRVSMKTCTGDCCGGPDAEDWRLVSLSDLSATMVYPFAFDDGGIHVSPDKGFKSVAAGSFCKAGPACVERKDGGKDERLLIPCGRGGDDVGNCEAVIRDLAALIKLYDDGGVQPLP